jgi:hypothetical protein
MFRTSLAAKQNSTASGLFLVVRFRRRLGLLQRHLQLR